MKAGEHRSESPTLCTFYNADFIIYSSSASDRQGEQTVPGAGDHHLLVNGFVLRAVCRHAAALLQDLSRHQRPRPRYAEPKVITANPNANPNLKPKLNSVSSTTVYVAIACITLCRPRPAWKPQRSR